MNKSDPTWQFHDSGESEWPVRIHCPCGDVYLSGYINCDLAGRVVADPPEDATMPSDYYYGRTVGTSVPPRVDAYADMRGLDVVAEPGTVHKILCVQGLEHLTRRQGRAALEHWHEMLCPTGVAVVSVPDTLGTCDGSLSDFAVRHLRGTHKNARFVHQCHYTHQSLRAAMLDAGFRRVRFYPDDCHTYPAIVARAWK